jgi:hypothetical protein
MMEILANPQAQIPGWIAAVTGQPVDWGELLAGYQAQVDWPGASFWREILAASPDAFVLLSVRDPEAWYKSASNTIFSSWDRLPPEAVPWMTALRGALHERFSDDFDNPEAMIAAYERHNQQVRDEVPGDRLLEWRPADGWEPICARLGVAVPDEPFPVTNSTNEFRAMLGLDPI